MALDNLATMAQIDRLILSIGEDDFGDALFHTTKMVGDVDHVMVFAFAEQEAPRVVINTGLIGAEAAAEAAAAYVDELYALDPNLPQIRSQPEGRAGWFEFEGGRNWDERLHRGFLAPTGISDMVLFAVMQEKVVYLVQMHRLYGHHFARAQRWLLTQVGELIAANIRKHFSYMHTLRGPNQFLIGRVLTEAAPFQSITPRERLVCIGILTGHTSESIARNLSISVNSVLTYRKRLYEKLEISSQNELFVRIIDSLMRLNWDAKDLPAAGGGLEINASRARLKGRPLAADLEFAQAFFNRSKMPIVASNWDN
ncbi:LuxR family transcriptional regulator [Sphingomonas histidinilytica]|uniref:DNA-binding transcriptional regulator, CsgD family n=1 Tax=Rhizorhabdus histidinilytica TaxID=439228 RepID=A0A1T5FNG2_9SPHN|nr:helix-turn-helix transcriptional regulator [Rhizorhabdus histidinilytica]MBO9377142.1 LuxR family transcriptional regulator [Rhizorhabdus histidinilytica]QEH79979.1 helix-turn-helix transcriptional regulator [Sphingomonas sp. C8-2]SKB97678.1 DNA-binding transcriptional regulator, CsgD family [Rhizorhabdus histidinilytica]